ncbi:MAG: tol-pal system YbgF family protein [Sphingomonadaceae bacterium]
MASADSIRGHAVQSLEQKNFTDAAKNAEELIKKTPDSYDAYFLLAQARAQLGDKNAALAALETAIKKGYKDDQAINANANLQSLHGMAAYDELMGRAFPRAAPVSSGATVGITETSSGTVIRAGDVSVELPKDK